MANSLFRSVATLSLAVMLCNSALADVRNDYELTVASVVKAVHGWQLYQEEKFAGSFANGHYTDPDRNTRVKDFWSDGRIAKLDRDNNGHFETIFVVVKSQLVYAGSIGRDGSVINAAKHYKHHLGQSAAAFVRSIQRRPRR